MLHLGWSAATQSIRSHCFANIPVTHDVGFAIEYSAIGRVWTCQTTISAPHAAILAYGTVDIFDTTSAIPTLSIEDEAGGCSVRQKTTLGVG
jgi:hypothetical protein